MTDIQIYLTIVVVILVGLVFWLESCTRYNDSNRKKDDK
jgi:hypothetical protein